MSSRILCATLSTVLAPLLLPLTRGAVDTLSPPQLTEVWSPIPPVVSAPPGRAPSDAIVLFDGRNADEWESAKDGAAVPWQLEDGALVVVRKTGDIRTKRRFGDVQLHLEFRTPAMVAGEGQGRGNSGVFFMGLYELQILDSYQNQTYVNGQAASVYKQHIPRVNASRAPGEWQTYDAIFLAPRFDAAGKVLQPAYLTVFHNGVLVHYHVALRGPTAWRGTPSYTSHPSLLPLQLQEHGNPVAFRHIWIRELRPIEGDR